MSASSDSLGSNSSTAGTAKEDTIHVQEPLGKPRVSSGVSEAGDVGSTALSDAGSAGATASEAIPIQSHGELEAAGLPLRPGPTVTAEERGPVQSDLYKYLLVDDNDINLRILASFMKRLGHAYDTAVNGLEALQMYTNNPGLYPFVLMGKLLLGAHELWHKLTIPLMQTFPCL